LAGLSAAYHLESDYEVYESESKAGGVCSSNNNGDFIFDIGIHVLHTKNHYVLNLLNKLMGNNLAVQERRAKIFSNGVYTKYPFQVHTYGLPSKIVETCVTEFIKAKSSKTNIAPNNYFEWVIKNFGKGFAENFMLPYSRKMWCCDPVELTLDWMDVRIPQPTVEEVVEGASGKSEKEFGVNAQFQYPIFGGSQAIIDAFASKIKPIKFNKKVVKICLKNKEIWFKDGEKISYDKVISTIPLPELVDLIDECPIRVKQAANDLKFVSDTIVNLGVNQEKLSDDHWIYFPEEKYPFLRISFPKNLSKNTVPKDKSSVQAEIFHSPNSKISSRRIMEESVGSLIDLGIIKTKESVVYKDIIDIKYAYITYDCNRKRNVKLIHNFLRKNSIYPCGRFGQWQYLWMDDAILDGKKIAQKLETKSKKNAFKKIIN
jgi:protoporphyrinogen oxidase